MYTGEHQINLLYKDHDIDLLLIKVLVLLYNNCI